MQAGGNGYSHLLTGAAAGLECVACLQIDDLAKDISADILFEHAMAFFDHVREHPKRVTYWTRSEARAGRTTVAGFRRHLLGMGHSVGGTLRSLTVTGRGFEDDPVSNTWTPRAVLSAALNGRILEAFVQTPDASASQSAYLADLAGELFGSWFAAGYLFEFPWAFSPFAYSAGLSYSPDIKALGTPTDRDTARVANWASHCFRGKRASEGYLRDVYPISILSSEHLRANVGRTNLESWVRSDLTRGSLTRYGDKWLWAIEPPHLASVQRSLDSADLLLGGIPPD